MYTTYAMHNVGKTIGGKFVPGASDFISSVGAFDKAEWLDSVLQVYYQAGGFDYDNTDIGLTDVKKAIAYARDKKHTKGVRKATKGSATAVITAISTATGATLGSVVPGLGTAVGGVGGAVAGMSLSTTVTAGDMLKRASKWLYKKAKGTQGVHREQAASCLYYNGGMIFIGGPTAKDKSTHDKMAAYTALIHILGAEFDEVMAKGDVERIAKRLKSV